MQLIQSADACRLTGLTSHQLREWCSRRAILLPDVPGGGRGRHALFSWQTVLVLRLLHELHERFGVEVGARKVAMEDCRRLLNGRAFPGLWTTTAVFTNRHQVRLSDDRELVTEALLVLPLEPHLQSIADGFAFPPQAQFPLFRAVELRR